VINTHPDYGAAAQRTLLLAAPDRAVLIAPRRDVDPLPRLVTAAFQIAPVRAGAGGEPAVVLATRHDRAPADGAESVLRHIALHPGAKVVNAWRDALLALARDAGTPMTKNEARARVAAWIEDYNHNRRHSACGMMSPVAWELAAGREAA